MVLLDETMSEREGEEGRRTLRFEFGNGGELRAWWGFDGLRAERRRSGWRF
jgi:hypothetical protein